MVRFAMAPGVTSDGLDPRGGDPSEAPDEPSIDSDPEILRRRTRRWASALTLSITVVVVVTGGSYPWLLAVCCACVMAMHLVRLSRWTRVALLIVAAATIGPSMYDAVVTWRPSVAPLYAMVVFTGVMYTPHLAVAAGALVILLVIEIGHELWPTAAAGDSGSAFALLLPSALLLAFCYSWRRSVLLEHARARMGRSLAHQNRALRRALAVLDQLGAVEERARIAREIHDRIGHCLTSIHVYLETAGRHVDPRNQGATLAIERGLEATSLALREVRDCVEHLRTSNEAQPFAERVRRMIERYALREKVELVIESDERVIPRRLQEVLLRCLQESLTNAARHSEAKRIVVRLEGAAERIELSIRDDGQGAAALQEGFGLQGMRERVLDLGGQLDLHTARGAGFTVRVRFRVEDSP